MNTRVSNWKPIMMIFLGYLRSHISIAYLCVLPSLYVIILQSRFIKNLVIF